MNAEVLAISSYLPRHIRKNDWFKENCPETYARSEKLAFSKLYSSQSEDDIFAKCAGPYLSDPFRGAVERRIVSEDETSSMMEIEALRKALAAANLEVDALDLIICVSFRSDEVAPGNAARVAQALGSNASVLNLEATCSGSFMALQLAVSLIETGQYKCVGIATSASYSRDHDYSNTLSWFLADAAGAMIVGASNKGALLSSSTVSTTESVGAFKFRPCGTQKYQVVMEKNIGVDMRSAMARNLEATYDDALKKASLTRNDVDFLVVNTPMAFIAEFTTTVLGLKREQTVSCFEQTANVGPALTVVNLWKAVSEGKLKAGDIVAIHAFGTVSNAGTMIFRWGDTKFAPPSN